MPKKKPTAAGWGDNFFKPVNDGYAVAFNTASHFGRADKIAADLKMPVAVVGKRFWYFGANAPELPAALWNTKIPVPGIGRRGHRVTTDKKTTLAFVKWIESFTPGIHGAPRDASAAQKTGTRHNLSR